MSARRMEVRYLASKLLQGETFRQTLRHGPLPPRKAVEYARQIAAGLIAAHDKRLIHRDLKPENLFLTASGQVNLLDFGLVKVSPIARSEPAPDAATITVANDT